MKTTNNFNFTMVKFVLKKTFSFQKKLWKGKPLVIGVQLLFLITLIFTLGCKSVQLKKRIANELEKPFNNQHFSGFFVYNPTTKDTLINYNGNKYFTPASNVKIATLFTSLQLLKNKIPAYTYAINGDTISVQGTGNPTLFHPFFKDSLVINMLKGFSNVVLFTNNLKDTKYGAGWAWEDYDSYYSPERSSFPIYGNVTSIKYNNGLKVTPKTFYNNVLLTKQKKRREENKNIFYYPQQKEKEITIPFIVDSTSIKKLWKEILPLQNITFYHDSISSFKNTKYSEVSLDSLCKKMMVESDNFLAEQLLIMASSTLSDTLSSSKIRKYMLKNYLFSMPNKPRWVDGSGLSRYNLFTPSSLVFILNKMYATTKEEKLFNLFPKGGVSGTLKKSFKGKDQPYIIAKSGSLGNNYSLSGFLKTKSGKTLIFSFMNNHYKKKTSDIKKQMELIFEYLRDTY